MKLTKAQIREIAEEIDSGMVCYVHKQTKEIIALPDDRFEGLYDMEFMQDLFDKVEENSEDYVAFHPMPPRDSFTIMEKFAQQVNNAPLQESLFQALNRSKPFRNFRNVIDNAGSYRESWFEFKQRGVENYVIGELEWLQDEDD